ncbi:LOW QUALITY PROTEIN: CH domain-containing protein/Arm domain-containing protein/IQ domain-containing protein [Cephalotus follicularis]|uniref:CH domain-containing protein/Arm domain-containing protein/IQ domain-containing protein n=1 Tax=Cephalotus follicularis TaxID=3775 RepID=A0A1Q3AMW6_CEPFO|nr:LOW QUALITY PROTEIN: CH domain-containing protein/Arm domain-containing protein/IQ domain-containing protein [Cephalotus follicularis]
MDGDEQPFPSPAPSPSLYQPTLLQSSLLNDISNFKTPKRPSKPHKLQTPNSSQFFTASKQTPRTSSSFRPRSTTAARRLKAFALEQTQSSRKAQIQKENSLKSLSKSLTVWLNFLFQDPRSCGCDSSIHGDHSHNPTVLGKRDGGGPRVGDGVGVDVTWRTPKRLRDLMWGGDADVEEAKGISRSMFGFLKGSLKEVCSFDDLLQRMRGYFSLSVCKEIFKVMTRVTKTIDEGRLKMRPHCPIVTDVGLKDKATRVLMCYNPIWLRIGLYVIFGGDSLLFNEDDVSSGEEITFLKMLFEKQLFSHAGLAKSYAYNKNVDGLYRPGYYEALGNVILKRILLLVLILDRAKTQTCLPLKFGIDGVDGGSPLLFAVQSSNKSSREVVNDLLSSDVMHGEGNLFAHLVILGYRVSYQQCSLIEYDFRVTDLFVDLQDGVRLCRAIQLLQHDPSILQKLVVPSDTHKKNLANCCIALQLLRQAGIMLCDEDGMTIEADDVANGDKELILSLLWNCFVHLQLPLLINKTTVIEEISKIRGFDVVCFRLDEVSLFYLLYLKCNMNSQDHSETKAEESIVSAAEYADAVHNFILSQKMAALPGNFPEVLQINDLLEHNGATSGRSVVILLAFLSAQLIGKKKMDQLNFHKLLGCNCQSPQRRHSNLEHLIGNSEPVIDKGEIDRHDTEDAARKFKAIQAWWRDLTDQNSEVVVKSSISSLQWSLTGKNSINIQRENASKIIQSHFRRLIGRRNFLKMVNAVCFLQVVVRAWLTAKQIFTLEFLSTDSVQWGRWMNLETFRRYLKFIADRHGFVKLRRSVLVIQRAARLWIAQRHQSRAIANHNASATDLVKSVIVIQKCIRGWTTRLRYNDRVAQIEEVSLICRKKDPTHLETKAAVKIQLAWNSFVVCKSIHNQNLAATKIQSHIRGWLLTRRFLNLKQAITKIQSYIRCRRCLRAFKQQNIATSAAITIQSHVRGWFARRFSWRLRCLIIVTQLCSAFLTLLGFFYFLAVLKYIIQDVCVTDLSVYFFSIAFVQYSFVCFIFSLYRKCHLHAFILFHWQSKHAKKKFSLIVFICFFCGNTLYLFLYLSSCLSFEFHCRGMLVRRDFFVRREAVIKIQSAVRCLRYLNAFRCHTHAATEIQSFIRGHITRLRLLGASSYRAAIPSRCNFQNSGGCFQSFELRIVLFLVLKLQRWWKGIMLLKLRMKSAIIVQCHVRGWIARRKESIQRHHIVMIQSYWKGYLVRKESKGQLLDLRLRVQRSAANVDDSMRIINRLLSALSELLSMRSVSGILHTCATLDGATEYSRICCEKLVAAGAIDTLLKLIRSVSRSIPDQEVRKHALSTLRNLARYPDLIEVLIDSHGSVEIVLQELLRNKEGFFIASEVLKNIASNDKGVEAIRKLPALLKRLHNLVEELKRKASIEKRNGRILVARENTERRLREAVELLKLTANS